MPTAKTGLLLLCHVGDAREVGKTGPRHVVLLGVHLDLHLGQLLEAVVLLRPRVCVQAACAFDFESFLTSMFFL